jgi:hypothetical protein
MCGVQAAPHTPQFSESLARFVHEPAQRVSPPGQDPPAPPAELDTNEGLPPVDAELLATAWPPLGPVVVDVDSDDPLDRGAPPAPLELLSTTMDLVQAAARSAPSPAILKACPISRMRTMVALDARAVNEAGALTASTGRGRLRRVTSGHPDTRMHAPHPVRRDPEPPR